MIRIFDISACIRDVAAVLGKHGATVSDAEEVFKRVISGAVIEPQADRSSMVPNKSMPEPLLSRARQQELPGGDENKDSNDKSAVQERNTYQNTPAATALNILVLMEKEGVPGTCVDEILDMVRKYAEIQ